MKSLGPVLFKPLSNYLPTHVGLISHLLFFFTKLIELIS